MRARDGQVDDRPHDPGGRRRGPDQDGARAAPPGAAADARLRAAQPGARPGAHAVLHQHRDAALDPRRRRSRGGPASTPSASAASTPTRCSRSGTGRRPPSHRAAVGQRGLHPRGRLRAGAGSRRPASCAAALDAGRAPALADLALHARPRTRPGAPTPRRLAIVASSTEDLRQKLGQAIEKLWSTPTAQRIKTMSGIYYEARAPRPRGKGRVRVPRRGRAVPEHARRAVPAVRRGPRCVRPDRPALRRAPARAIC